MNGRIFDPEIARFLSADPLVQCPFSTQGLNRYAYTQNRPLTFTDPNGYDFGGISLLAAFALGTFNNFVSANDQDDEEIQLSVEGFLNGAALFTPASQSIGTHPTGPNSTEIYQL